MQKRLMPLKLKTSLCNALQQLVKYALKQSQMTTIMMMFMLLFTQGRDKLYFRFKSDKQTVKNKISLPNNATSPAPSFH